MATEVFKVLQTYGQQVLNEMKTRLVSAGKVASGTLLNSLKYYIESVENENLENDYELFFEGASYLDFVDKGRKPGKMPPVDEIKKWCQIKGLPEAAAWPIAINIAEFGIKPTNFYTLSVTRRVKQLEKLLEQAALKDAEILLQKELKDVTSIK